ncbi:MAG: DJ-1/PfpI family protein [Gammaproteobacteria bacterium]
MKIEILLYDNVTALDAIGPYEVLHLMPGAEISFVATTAGPIKTDAGIAMLNADTAVADAGNADIIVVPGTPTPSVAMGDEAVLDWVRRSHENTKWTTSVCTGAAVLGAAGLLNGIDATTHWMGLDLLKNFGANPTSERVVRQGKIVTAAGVSAGIDMALTLAAIECGQAVAEEIQLIIEYDPQPPFDAGSPAKAGQATVDSILSKFSLG